MPQASKSLKLRQSPLALASQQLSLLNSTALPKSFDEAVREHQLDGLMADGVEILQVNVGKMCNMTCRHCHVDAGPDRREIMTRETIDLCLDALRESKIHTLDLTGGAPEMNPHFRWFVEECVAAGKKVMNRCNLTIIEANKKYADLPEFFAKNKVHVVSSLPYFSKKRTDSQRGDGVFEDSISALQKLNAVGYGKPGSDLILDLVYNPSGAFLPDRQEVLEPQFKSKLRDNFNVEFNSLFCITNMPISRFLDYLIQSENYEEYMEELVNAFNPGTIMGLMCLNTISVSWDGYLYDCDFNQMLDLKVAPKESQHLSTFDIEKLKDRNVILNQHCYGCTAGAGSSCGCLLYTSPSPRDATLSRMPSSA